MGKNNKLEDDQRKQDGNVLFVVVIILLALLILTMVCMHSASLQMHLVNLRKETSNTYYLACGAVEKQVACMNNELENEIDLLIKDISKQYIERLTVFENDIEKLGAMKADRLCEKYEPFVYEKGQLKIVDEVFVKQLQKRIYELITQKYLINQYVISEEVSSDYTSPYRTTITVKVLPVKNSVKGREVIDQTQIKIMATAMTKNIKDNSLYDTQSVVAMVKIHISQDMTNQIHENYIWAARPPEILASGLISFSDVVITNGGSLEVENGDLQVKGSGQIHKDAIFRNGESLSSEITRNGGIIVSNGGKLKVKNGDLVCVNNIIATNGWSNKMDKYGLATQIEVLRGDLIANTVGIVDDYYKEGNNQIPFEMQKQGSNLSIHIGQNVFAENDVLISKWIRTAQISIDGTIFGVSDGSDFRGEKRCLNKPNVSSGVFVQGENTRILTDRILVNGQPYITVAHSDLPMKLWESVGAPFCEIDLWEGYEVGEERESNASYLEIESPYSPFIQRDKIQLYSTDILNTSYAPAKISANNTTSLARAISEDTAKKFFMKGFDTSDLKGNTVWQLKNYTSRGDYEGVDYILAQTKEKAEYYEGLGEVYKWYKKALMYGKCYHEKNETFKSDYLGLRGYIIAKQSVFYGKVDEKDVPQSLGFDEVIEDLPIKCDEGWSSSNPVIIIDENDEIVDVSKLYHIEGSSLVGCPGLIINGGNGTLTLIATDKKLNVFNGVIISKGNVRVKGNIQINGSLIIQGKDEGMNPERRESRMCGMREERYSPGLVIDQGAHLKICYDGDMLLKVHLTDNALYRQILDALKITQYDTKNNLKEILGPFHSEKLNYSVGKVFYKTNSTLDIAMEEVKLKIEVLKKISD